MRTVRFLGLLSLVSLLTAAGSFISDGCRNLCRAAVMRRRRRHGPLSARVTRCSSRSWRSIYDANVSRLGQGQPLQVGMEIEIPVR
jgi:hypothetical protein